MRGTVVPAHSVSKTRVNALMLGTHIPEAVVRGGPALRDSSAAWLRWILGSITPPISPRLPA